MSDIKLTPSEDLLLDALCSRARLGEPFWPFENRHRPTLRSLEAKGLITTESNGSAGRRARLTPAARERFLDPTYTPPGAKIEWAVQTADDSKPIHYTLRSPGQEGSEEYHRKMADRTDGSLFRRVTIVGDWQLVVESDADG